MNAHAAARARFPSTAPSPTSARCSRRRTATGLPLLLKGPTGCGKTRFVEHMAARLGLPLFTVACHDDLSAADLIGRYLLRGGETEWVDGPLTRAVRDGGICYLDEVVEARKDVTVVLHPLTDDRRRLVIDRTGEELAAPRLLHARRQLQPRLPVDPEEAEALDPPALRLDRLRLPRPGDGDRRPRRRDRPRRRPAPGRSSASPGTSAGSRAWTSRRASPPASSSTPAR